MRTQGSSKNVSSSNIVHRKEAKPIIIDVGDSIYSVAVLSSGKHVVSGDGKGKIRRWRVEDGKKVGTPMGAGSAVYGVAVSCDGKLIVSGTKTGSVTVWNAESHSRVTQFKAHNDWVFTSTVDVSPDATKIVTGSDDCTVCIWSLSTGKRLLGPLEHSSGSSVVATKFSPDGRLIATATRKSVRVYDSQTGGFVEFPVEVYSAVTNIPLSWTTDSKHLFVSSHDGYIHRVNVPTGTTVSKWHIHSSDSPTCIALAGNETFIAASTGSSVSFWDTTSQEQIGTVIEHTHVVWSMAMSSNYDLVTGGGKKITLWALGGILPSHYLDNVSVPA